MSRSRRWWVLAVLCLVLAMVAIDNSILSVAIPSIRRELGAGASGLQWITTAYGLVLSGLLLPLAVVGDRMGRRALLVIGLVVFGLGSTWAALATSTTALVVSRGVMGVGGAAAMPATLAILSNVFDEQRDLAIAIWSAVAGLAAATGPLVGGVLLERFWWGSVLLVNVPVVVAALGGTGLVVPTSRDPAARPIDVAGATLWWGALSGLLFAIIEGPVRGWGSATVLVGFGATLAFAFGFGVRQRRAPSPLVEPATARLPSFRAGVITVTTAFFGLFGSQFVLTQWLQGPRRASPLVAGAFFAPSALASVVAAAVAPRIGRRIGYGGVAMIGLTTVAVGLLATGLAVMADTSAIVAATLAAVGIGMGLAAPAGIELIMSSVPPERAGSGAGVNETVVEAGGAVGVAVLGTLLTGTHSYRTPLPVGAAILLVAAAVVWTITRARLTEREAPIELPLVADD